MPYLAAIPSHVTPVPKSKTSPSVPLTYVKIRLFDTGAAQVRY
jgi:hypothetical protein